MTQSSTRFRTQGDTSVFSGQDAARKVRLLGSVHEHRTFIWQVWPGRNWPVTQTEEVAFLADLTVIAASVKGASASKRHKTERSDITALLNALRCGLRADELFERAPGLNPRRILQAYHEIESLRARSIGAWEQIVATPTLETVVKHMSSASVLLSVPVSHLLPSAVTTSDAEFHKRAVAVAEKIARVREQVTQIESFLDKSSSPDAEAVELGRLLYDPYDPTLWAHPYFAPTRVGELMPLRLAALLGERNS